MKPGEEPHAASELAALDINWHKMHNRNFSSLAPSLISKFHLSRLVFKIIHFLQLNNSEGCATVNSM